MIYDILAFFTQQKYILQNLLATDYNNQSETNYCASERMVEVVQ